MKISLLIPVGNHAKVLPALLRELGPLAKKNANLEILFVDAGSGDGGDALIEAAKLPRAQWLRESRRGLAEALNRGLAAARGELLLFLAADTVPRAGWLPAMEKALESGDLAVGQTLSRAEKKSGMPGRVAAKLFSGHSERTAHARGHALPWGPYTNLGARRSLVEKIGPFSPEAAAAFDIDWCWRGMLKGARIVYARAAKTQQSRGPDHRALLEEFERYGLGEAWLHRTYSFLLSPEDQAPDPLLASVDAFRRLREHAAARQLKSLLVPLEEVAVAFAGGVRLGYEHPHRECPLERSVPREAIAWENGPKETTVFVPGKGVATLKGKQRQIWEAMRAGASPSELVRLFTRVFRVDEHTAHHELAHFRENFEP